MEAKHVLFLFDSCFSGTIFKSKALPEIPPHISEITSRPVRQFIAAGDAGQQVPARSIFAKCFIRALKGEADLSKDGYVTGSELGMYLHDKVLYYRTGQTPQYGKIRDPDLDEGDFVFVVLTKMPDSDSTKISQNGTGNNQKKLNLTGKWSGVIKEKGKEVMVSLELEEQAEKIIGSFNILSSTGEDAEMGQSFPIVNAVQIGNKFSFIVPLTGEIDDDAILFFLEVKGGKLIGTGKERREKAKPLPIIFRRQ